MTYRVSTLPRPCSAVREPWNNRRRMGPTWRSPPSTARLSGDRGWQERGIHPPGRVESRSDTDRGPARRVILWWGVSVRGAGAGGREQPRPVPLPTPRPAEAPPDQPQETFAPGPRHGIPRLPLPRPALRCAALPCPALTSIAAPVALDTSTAATPPSAEDSGSTGLIALAGLLAPPSRPPSPTTGSPARFLPAPAPIPPRCRLRRAMASRRRVWAIWSWLDLPGNGPSTRAGGGRPGIGNRGCFVSVLGGRRRCRSVMGDQSRPIGRSCAVGCARSVVRGRFAVVGRSVPADTSLTAGRSVMAGWSWPVGWPKAAGRSHPVGQRVLDTGYLALDPLAKSRDVGSRRGWLGGGCAGRIVPSHGAQRWKLDRLRPQARACCYLLFPRSYFLSPSSLPPRSSSIISVRSFPVPASPSGSRCGPALSTSPVWRCSWSRVRLDVTQPYRYHLRRYLHHRVPDCMLLLSNLISTPR